MDKALEYLKVNPNIAFEYSQAWSELLEKFPFLISFSSKRQWRDFCENHQQQLEEMHQEFPNINTEKLWILGPLSTSDAIQDAIIQNLEKEETEKSEEKKKNETYFFLPHLPRKEISGSLVIKNNDNTETPLVGATVVVKDIKTKKELDKQITNSNGRFQTKPLFLKRYLLVFQHPLLHSFNKNNIHRVVNLRAFQPPLKIAVFNTMPPFTDEEQVPSENNQPTPSQAEVTKTTSDKTGDNSDQITPEKQPLSSKQTNEDLVPFVFITSPTPSSLLVSQKAAFQPLADFNIEIPFSDEIKQDPYYQQLREEQIKRWEAENQESITSVKGQDYMFGKGPSSLEKDTLALFVKRFPLLAQKYKDQEANKIYQDRLGKINPESDPVFQKIKAEAQKAMNRVLENWKRAPTSLPIPLQRATIEAILPYYRYFAEHFPKKAFAYAQFDNALNFVVGLLTKRNHPSSTSENKQLPTSPIDLDNKKISIESSKPLIISANQEEEIEEEESSDEDEDSSFSSSNEKERRSQNLPQSAEKNASDRTFSPSRSNFSGRPLRAFSRPSLPHPSLGRALNTLPQKQIARMLGGRLGQSGRFGVSSAVRVVGLAARAAPLLAHPATWIVIAILLILLLLLLALGGDESTNMQGRFTEFSKNTTDQQVTNPETQSFCTGRNCATVQGASTSANVLAAIDTNLFEAISNSLKAVGNTVDEYQQELQKIAERIKESQITYTIRVVYEGQAEDIIVKDPIPNNALFISASGKYTTEKQILPNGLEKVTAVVWSVRENQGITNSQSGSSSGQLTDTSSNTAQTTSVNFTKYTQSPYYLPPPDGPSDINFSESQMNDMNTLGALVAKYQSYLRTKVKNGDPKYIDPFLSVIWTGAVEGIGGYRFFWNCQDTHKEINRGCVGGYYSGGWQVGYGIQVSQATSHIVEDFEAAYGKGSASNPSKVREVGQRVINDSGGKITNPSSFPEISLTTLASRAQSGDNSAQQAIAILLMDKDLGAIALAREIAGDIAARDNWRSTMEGWAPYYKQFMQKFSNRAKALADRYKGIPMGDSIGTASTFVPQEFTITILPLVQNELFESSRATAEVIGGQGNLQEGEKSSSTSPPNPNATCPGVGPITCGTKQGSAAAPACHCTASYQASACSWNGGKCDYCAPGVDSASYAIDITNPLNGPVYIPKISINGEAHSVTCKGYANQTGVEPEQVIEIVSCSDDVTDEPIWMQFHHSRKSNPIEINKYYKSGDVVGYSGSFQVFNSGPHVHFQIGVGGPCGFDGIQGCRNADQYVQCNR